MSIIVFKHKKIKEVNKLITKETTAMSKNTKLTLENVVMKNEKNTEEQIRFICVFTRLPKEIGYVFDDALTQDFECSGDEVLVASSPPASPDMAARLAQPAQGNGGGASPSAVRELIVIPELTNTIHLQHTIQQVTSTVVEVNGDSSGQSSPTTDQQHTYITVASENGNGVNYHVQYVEPQEIYTQTHQTMESLRSYPVYDVATVEAGVSADTGAAGEWGEPELGAYPVGEPPASPAPPRMPPATVQWLRDHYECAEGVSLPRSTLYAHYLRHCTSHRLEPVNAASFGKLIRSVFVGLRTRRLGTRGNSKYHYYGIRAKQPLQETETEATDDTAVLIAQQMSREGRAGSGAGGTAAAGGVAGTTTARTQYLGAVSAPSPPALQLAALCPAALAALRKHHRQHGTEFLEAVAALDTAGVERARRQFWRRPPPGLCRRDLCRLTNNKEVAVWLRTAEIELYQKAVELLLPDVLKPIPPQLTQSIRNFAKSLELALAAGGAAAPSRAARAQRWAGGALAAALRRYTSLNHLAQAARAVLTNTHQIQQMMSDLNRVDFRVVREQAAWACACGAGPAATTLEQDFKATLGRGASLEQWAEWLESIVSAALVPHASSPELPARARRLLLDWSFYSSLVIRELTLRSAASFGSFHLLRLLYDEYVSYVIERRVAAHLHAPPIAVMHPPPEDTDSDDEDEECSEASAGEEDEEWGDWHKNEKKIKLDCQ